MRKVQRVWLSSCCWSCANWGSSSETAACASAACRSAAAWRRRSAAEPSTRRRSCGTTSCCWKGLSAAHHIRSVSGFFVVVVVIFQMCVSLKTGPANSRLCLDCVRTGSQPVGSWVSWRTDTWSRQWSTPGRWRSRARPPAERGSCWGRWVRRDRRQNDTQFIGFTSWAHK